MKKIDVSCVSPYDNLYVADLCDINNNDSVFVLQYFDTNIISGSEISILSAIDEKMKLYIQNRYAYSKLDLCYDSFIEVDECSYDSPRLRMEANKYMECMLLNSGIVKLGEKQEQVVSVNGQSALDVITDMYDVYEMDGYYEFLDDFIHYVRRNNIITRSRK